MIRWIVDYPKCPKTRNHKHYMCVWQRGPFSGRLIMVCLHCTTYGFWPGK